MTLPFAVKHALRESRSSLRRLGLYMGAIALGVAALVAINAYRANIVDAVRADAQRLLGGDLRLQSDRLFPDSVEQLIDSLASQSVRGDGARRDGAPGTRIARVTATLSMGVSRPLGAPDSGQARLVQVRAVERGYPFYDTWQTAPVGLWPALTGGDADAGATSGAGSASDDTRAGATDDAHRDALVEPELLLYMGAAVGDSIQLGNVRFRIAGTVEDLPAEFGFRAAAGPRVFIARRHIDDTGLITVGSISQHQAFVQFDDPRAAERFVSRHEDVLRRVQVDVETAQGQGEDITEAVSALSRFLGLVGLTALLLGGLGVGSAVNVFVKDKRTTIATLRCLGATQKQAFLAYLVQAAALGLIGAAAGVVLGLLVQAALPVVLRDALPVDVSYRLRALPILSGLLVGVIVALLFALLPLLEIRGITPLQAIRHDVEPVRRRFDPLRSLAYVVLVVGTAALAVWQAGHAPTGLAYAGAIVAVVLLLTLGARLLIGATRRWAPSRARFVVRQGIANLFRPHNQTAAVTVALGFGVFLVATMWLVQFNLVDQLRIDDTYDQPNVLAFGIAREQRDSIAAFVARVDNTVRTEPIVTARIAAINGDDVETIPADPDRDVEPWALRREYRNTYRDSLTSNETLVAGEWFGGARATDAVARISIEDDVAGSMGVALGDTLTWDIQGRRVQSVITSIRDVDWASLDTNYFVVFEPGSLDAAPQSFLLLAHVAGVTARAELRRDLALAFPNVSTVDLAQVQQTIGQLIERTTLGIRFMGLFTVLSGILVLAGAIASARYQRMRETVLLRMLGARRAQIRAILLTEFVALGTLAGATGGVLATAAAWALTRFVFEFPFALPVLPLTGIIAATAALAVLVGAGSSRRTANRTVLEAMRG